MSLFESRLEQNERELSTPRAETAVNYDTISLLGSEELSKEVVCKELESNEFIPPEDLTVVSCQP